MTRVAIELVTGGLAQAVCRTRGCTWKGTARLRVADAQRDQAEHRGEHDTPRLLVTIMCPGCEHLVELDVRTGTPDDPHVLAPHEGCEASELGALTVIGDLGIDFRPVVCL